MVASEEGIDGLGHRNRTVVVSLPRPRVILWWQAILQPEVEEDLARPATYAATSSATSLDRAGRGELIRSSALDEFGGTASDLADEKMI
jgi:hypothetical protein